MTENMARVHFIDDSERLVPVKNVQYVGEEGARRATAIVDGREVPIYKRTEPEWGPLWYEQEIENPLHEGECEACGRVALLSHGLCEGCTIEGMME